MRKVSEYKPDILLLDVMMSTWQDGFEMSRQLKQKPESKGIPILILTSIEEKTGVPFKSSAGDPDWLPVDGFLDKPVDLEQLKTEIARVLRSNDADEDAQ